MEMIRRTDNGSIRYLELNNHNSKNSLDLEMAKQLLEAVIEANNKPDCNVMIFSSTGRAHFSKGPDINQLMLLTEQENGVELLDDVISILNQIIIEIYESPKLTIAAIHGYAYGGGLNIMLACDYRLTTDHAKFIESFLSMGVTPDLSSSYFLPKLIGMTRTTELLFTGRMFTGAEATQWGMFHESYPKRVEMSERAKQLGEQFEHIPLDILSNTKMLLRESLSNSLEEQLTLEKQFIVKAFNDPKIKTNLMTVNNKKLL